MVINTHSQYPTFDINQFKEIVAYAKSLVMEFATVSEGMKHFGNLIDIESNPTKENFSLIDANGIPWGRLNSQSYIIDATNVTFDLPVTDNKFKNGINMCHFNNSLASSYGWPTAGVLFTYRMSNVSYSFQRYVYFNSPVVLQRQWMGSRWSEFINISGNLRLTSSQRQRLDTSNLPVGHSVFDTTIMKPTWWNGNGWTDATNTSVD